MLQGRATDGLGDDFTPLEEGYCLGVNQPLVEAKVHERWVEAVGIRGKASEVPPFFFLFKPPHKQYVFTRCDGVSAATILCIHSLFRTLKIKQRKKIEQHAGHFPLGFVPFLARSEHTTFFMSRCLSPPLRWSTRLLTTPTSCAVLVP